VRNRKCKKMVFPTAIREKLQRWVALSCDAHLMFASSGRIRQPCTFLLSDPVSCGTFLISQHFCTGNSDSSEFSSEFSDLKTLSSNIKVNPVILWNGQNSIHRIFPSNSQDFTTPQISFEFSGFFYTSNCFLIKPIHSKDQKTGSFREILSQRKARGEDRVE